LIAVLITAGYFLAYPLAGITIILKDIAALLIFVGLCMAAGRAVIRAISAKTEIRFASALEKNIFEFGAGTGAVIAVMFILGVAGLYHTTIIWVAVLSAFAFLHRDILSLFRELSAVKMPKIDALHAAVLFFILISAGLVAVTCFAPPTYYDSLVYHLALPGMYIMEGKIFSPLFNIYSHFPQNMEMLYTLALFTGTETLPNLFSFAFGIFSLLAVFCFCRRFFNRGALDEMPGRMANGTAAGLVSALLLSTTTSFMLLAGSSYVEGGLAFFTFMSVFSVSIYAASRSDGFLYLAGAFSGLAMGTKYTGVITPAAISVILFIILLKDKKLSFASVKKILVMNSIAVMFFLPWAIKNIINVGNPVFPFLYNVLGFKNIPWPQVSARNYFAVLTEYGFKSNILLELFQLPWNIISTPQKYGGGIDVLGDFGWVIYFVTVPAVLLLKEKRKEVLLLLGYVFLHFIVWFSAKPVLRFLYPLLPVLAVISGYTISAIRKEGGTFIKIFVHSLVVLLLVSNFSLYFNIQKIIDPFWVALGIETRGEYLAKKLKYSPYPAFDYINRNLPVNDKIYFIGEQRGFYCKRDYIATNVYAPDPFAKLANDSKNHADMLAKIRGAKITHLLYNKNEAGRLAPYGILNFTPRGKKNWENLIKNLEVEFNKNDVYLYRTG